MNTKEKSPMRRHIYPTVVIFFTLLMLTGCAAENMAPVSGASAGYAGAAVTETVGDGHNTSGNGTMLVGEPGGIGRGQQEAVFSYMDRYYESVSSLTMAELTDLFEDTAEADRLMNQAAWEYLIGLRSLQGEDLKLDSFQYELTLQESQELEDGGVRLQFNENSIQRFSRHPDTDTEIYNIYHTFVLIPDGDGWKIRAHWQEDGIYQNIMGEYRGTEPDQIPDAGTYFSGQKEFLLTQAREQLEKRGQEYGSVSAPWVRYPYDRAAAVAYAEKWVGKRNADWADFTGKGGNCQNFVSQCLFAAGIPRDISGDAVWSWSKSGSHMWEDEVTSNAWINVAEFRRYAAGNRGYGLVAVTGAPFMEGEPGDVIQMGFPGGWNHAVLIGSVVKDEQRRTVDYLIDSNTTDVKNFPVSAYPIPCQSLTKIYGWRSR